MSFQPKVFLHKQRAALHSRFVSGWKSQALFEFITFGIKQAWACLFGGLMLVLLLGTFLFYPAEAALSRYDFITLSAIAIQVLMLALKLESWEEARVIFVFHIVGTVMEIFKVHMGSWLYPEASILNIAGVPLFSGFMYACVGSYLARVWRIFDFKFDRFPSLKWQGLLAVLIYLNFFTHHFGPDIRLALFIGSAILYGPAMVWFRADEVHRPMPLLIGLVLVALFIWFAENLGTFAKAWTYPDQDAGWRMVSFAKLGSWYLLMIISFVLVAAVQGASRKE
jgi:uncharacterized membrane protein YoaT (DUF817 family)